MAYPASMETEEQVDVYEGIDQEEEQREVASVESLELIRYYAKLARDDDYYHKIYLLNLFMAGDYEALRQYRKTGAWASSGRTGDPDLPDYPYINPGFMSDGMVNHAQISSRINVQSVVYADPEVEFITDLSNVKAVNLAWLQDRWQEGDWENKFYEIGMDVETCGYGFALLGVNAEGRYDVERIAPGDLMRDHLRRSPADWRYVFVRRRLDVEEAIEKYGGAVSEQRIRNAATQSMTTDVSGGTNSREHAACKVVYEWAYWSDNAHCVFLGGIQNGIVLALEFDDQMSSYSYREGPPALNPFGKIPLAVWADSYVGASRRSIGKAESTLPIVQMLNNMEVYARESIRRGLPMNVVSTVGMKPSVIKALEQNQDYEELGKLILTDNDDASRAFHRVEGLNLPQGFFVIRDQLRRELNGATGVMDSQRGQTQKGERTAYEFRRVEASGGVQARHMRHQYAKFLHQVVQKGRTIASMYETYPETLVLDDGDMVDSWTFDMAAVLGHPMKLRIHEESLKYRSEDEKMQARLALFNNFEAVLLQSPAQILNPVEIVLDVYRTFGVRDPSKFMNTTVLQGGSGTMPPVPPQPGVNPGVPGGQFNSPGR